MKTSIASYEKGVAGEEEDRQRAIEATRLFGEIETIINRSFELKQAGKIGEALELLEEKCRKKRRKLALQLAQQ